MKPSIPLVRMPYSHYIVIPFPGCRRERPAERGTPSDPQFPTKSPGPSDMCALAVYQASAIQSVHLHLPKDCQEHAAVGVVRTEQTSKRVLYCGGLSPPARAQIFV